MNNKTDALVLIVEDEPLMASMLKMQIESVGFTALGPFSTPEPAIAEASATPPDVAILDFNLEDDLTSESVAEWLAEKEIP